MPRSLVSKNGFIRIFLPRIALLVALFAGLIWFSLHYVIPDSVQGVGIILFQGGLKQVTSSYAGIIVSYTKEEGERISKGETIAFVRSNDNPETIHPIISHASGLVAEIIAYPDTGVERGQSVAILTDHGDPMTDLFMTAFVSSLDGKKIHAGMKTLIAPSIVDPKETGYLFAKVTRVGKLPMSKAAIQSIVKIPEVANYIREQLQAEPFVVFLSFEKDQLHKTGYQWSGPGPQFLLDSGIIADATIIVHERSIFERIFPALYRNSSEVW